MPFAAISQIALWIVCLVTLTLVLVRDCRRFARACGSSRGCVWAGQSHASSASRRSDDPVAALDLLDPLTRGLRHAGGYLAPVLACLVAFVTVSA